MREGEERGKEGERTEGGEESVKQEPLDIQGMRGKNGKRESTHRKVRIREKGIVLTLSWPQQGKGGRSEAGTV